MGSDPFTVLLAAGASDAVVTDNTVPMTAKSRPSMSHLHWSSWGMVGPRVLMIGLKRSESDGADADGETVERGGAAKRVDVEFACHIVHAHTSRLAGYGQPGPFSIVTPPVREADDTSHDRVGDFSRHGQRARLRLDAGEAAVGKIPRRGIVRMD